jgi:hypothetical protein
VSFYVGFYDSFVFFYLTVVQKSLIYYVAHDGSGDIIFNDTLMRISFSFSSFNGANRKEIKVLLPQHIFIFMFMSLLSAMQYHILGQSFFYV